MKIELQKGFNGDDFARNRITLIVKFDKLSVVINCKDNPDRINEDLWQRYLNFKSIKIFKHLMTVYPMGGKLNYYIH